MPLVFTKENEEVEVISIEGGHGVYTRLQEMGILPGTRIRVISNSNGPIIIGLRDSKIALGRGIGMKIIVRQI
ncbi:MAG: FeoA family protein [bacterium]